MWFEVAHPLVDGFEVLLEFEVGKLEPVKRLVQQRSNG